MKGLLIKDLYLLKDNKGLVCVIFAMAILFVTVNSDASFIVAFMTMITSMLAITTISYDEFDHSSSYLMTLPVTRHLYVKEKYCLGLLLCGSGWLLATIIATIIQYMNTPQLNFVNWFSILSSFIILGILCLSVMLPVQLKFGGDKGRIAIIGCVLGAFLMSGAIVWLCKLLGVDMEAIALHIMQLDILYIVGAVIVIACVCLFISYQISMRIMSRKQF